MKKFVAVLVLLCMALCLTACEGTEKTQTIYVQTESLRTVYGVEIRSVYTYSDTGRRLTTKLYRGDELYSSTSIRTSNGVTYMTVTDASGNETTQYFESTYDTDGNLITYEAYYEGSLYNQVDYTYDEKGNMLTASSQVSTGTTLTEYTYDENDLLVGVVSSCEETGTYSRYAYAYDENGWVTLEETYDVDGVLQSYIENVYAENESGITKTATYYNGDGTEAGQVITYVYDEHENLIQQTTTIDGDVAETIVNTYEAMEVPVEE